MKNKSSHTALSPLTSKILRSLPTDDFIMFTASDLILNCLLSEIPKGLVKEVLKGENFSLKFIAAEEVKGIVEELQESKSVTLHGNIGLYKALIH